MTLLASLANAMAGMPGPWMGLLMMLFWLPFVVLIVAGAAAEREAS